MERPVRKLLDRGSNVLLRVASAGSRFVLLLALAKVLSPAEVGSYGLALATVTLGTTIVGLEFYAFATREFLAAEGSRRSFVLQHASLAWLASYAALLPLAWACAAYWNIPGIAPAWMLALVIVEHLCIEANRLIVAMGRPMAASAWMFVRMGSWVWIMLPVLWLYPAMRRLEYVLMAWFAGGLVSLLGSVALIRRAAGPWTRWAIDRNWLRRGLLIGGMYLASSFAFRATFTLDRYLVSHLAGPQALGAYVLFIGMATSVITVIEPAILSFLSPQAVAAWQSGRHVEYGRIVRELFWSILALSTAGVVGIYFAAPFVVDWIDKPTYAEALGLLWILLAMAWICANGLSLDVVLYARSHDRWLTAATFAAAVAFVALVPLALHWLEPAHAVATSLLLAFAFSYLLRLAFVLRRTVDGQLRR